MLGTTLGDRYKIKSEIGHGGMATVYLGFDQVLKREVAIKILHAHLARDSELCHRFQQEASIAAGLEHPNIVKIYDYGEDREGRSYIVSEIIRGQNLHLLQMARNRSGEGLLGPFVSAMICEEVLNGLFCAHELNFIHRDVKPDNVMISLQGQVKLTDFGIAKRISSTMTQAGQYLGSPSYSSPEQVRGLELDFRTDLFSTGIILYEMLTGKLPFDGKSATDVMIKISGGEYAKLRVHETDAECGHPAALVAIVTRALQTQREVRYQSTASMIAELRAYLAAKGISNSRASLEEYSLAPAAFLASLKERRRLVERQSGTTFSDGPLLTKTVAVPPPLPQRTPPLPRPPQPTVSRATLAGRATRTPWSSRASRSTRFRLTVREPSAGKITIVSPAAEAGREPEPLKMSTAFSSAVEAGGVGLGTPPSPRVRHGMTQVKKLKSYHPAMRNHPRSTVVRTHHRSQADMLGGFDRLMLPLALVAAALLFLFGVSRLSGKQSSAVSSKQAAEFRERTSDLPPSILPARQLSELRPVRPTKPPLLLPGSESLRPSQPEAVPSKAREPAREMVPDRPRKRQIVKESRRLAARNESKPEVNSFAPPLTQDNTDMRTEVSQDIQKAGRQERTQGVSTIVLRTVPGGLPVLLNGIEKEPMSRTQTSMTFEVPAGKSLVAIRPTVVGATKYQGFEKQVFVGEGESRDLGLVRLVPLRVLRLKIAGPGVVAKVNGDPYVLRGGEISLERPEGTVEIEAKAQNGKSIRRSIDLQNDDFTLEASLE